MSIEQLVTNLAEYFRNLLFLKSGIAKDTLLGYAPTDFDAGVLSSLSAAQIEKAIELLFSLYRNLRFSLNQRFELELLLSRLSGLDAMITPSEIREVLAEMRVRSFAGARAVAAAPTAASAAEEAPVDLGQLLKKLAETIRRNSRLSLRRWTG